MDQVQPVSCPIWGAGGEVCSGAQVKTAESTEKFVVIQSAEPKCGRYHQRPLKRERVSLGERCPEDPLVLRKDLVGKAWQSQAPIGRAHIEERVGMGQVVEAAVERRD